MVANIDYRLGDGTETVAASAAGIATALRNRALVIQNPAVHTPSAAAITPFAGMLLTVRGSGLFEVSFNLQYAAVAADVVTFTITTYAQAAAGTPITLPAAALAVGQSCFVDQTGTGIAPTAGASAGTVIAAPAQTIGTAAANFVFDFEQICGSGGAGNVPTGAAPGLQWLVTCSVTNSVAARAISQLAMSAMELP